ncbi:hypothetical protein F2Q70_00030161 [Brassica cretica]|uniref:Uncharacterized protein n=1 Tax=Brassica cretica TaxID=69181 RepID=A0A8S9FD98_BRACR|nr:hypothetical protein F2Q70_00030161 [Brassica cretica]
MLYAAEQLVLDICNPELRENALHEFSKVLVCFARGGIYANENLSSQYSSAVSSTSLLTSVNHSLKPSNDACSKINSMFIPCCEDLIEPKSDHSHNIVEITNNTGKYLLDENLVDKPSCSTPWKRPNDIPSIESIEANGDAKEQQHLIRTSSVYAAAVSDSRSPLSAVN